MHYILVHGAWHGSWIWKYITPLLEARGNLVSAIDLPGAGLDAANFLAVTMDSYVQYVTSIINDSSLPVVLVGHSMAGCVISQVAQHCPNKISHLIYISGFIPRNNRSLIDEERHLKKSPIRQATYINEAECSMELCSSKIRELFYNCCDESDIVFALSKVQNQPLLPFLSKLSLSNDKFGKMKKIYIECLKDQVIGIEDQRRMQGYIKSEVISLDTDHSPFFSAVDKLVEALTLPIE